MNVALVFCGTDKIFSEFAAGTFSTFESNPPLGLAAIGTTALFRSCDVRIYDQTLMRKSNEALVREILSFEPNIVGFSCTSFNLENSIECAVRLKSQIKCLVFAGGIHISLCAPQVLSRRGFDFMISGEGEEVFSEVLDSLIAGKNISSLEIPGLWHKDTGKNCGTAILKNINQPAIDRSIFPLEQYRNKGALLEDMPCYSLFRSRGCPYRCRFCSKPAYFKIYRHRDCEQVIQEIEYLIDDFGAKAISFREDNFTVNSKSLEEFCEAMIYNFGGKFFWECESRAELSTQTLTMMYKAGCRGIWCGVETVNPKWQKWINKMIPPETVIKFYDDCKNIGIKTGALFMLGFPYQTDEELKQDVDFAMRLPVSFSAFQVLALFPGSPLKGFYDAHPELCARVNENISLALTAGMNAHEMIEREHRVNTEIRSSRLNYDS